LNVHKAYAEADQMVEAVSLATLTFPKVFGLDNRKGSLESGKEAYLVILENEFPARRTMIKGRWVFSAQS
jgi:N-acetylglucosamine-6-phosphate deacetylase